MTDRHLTPGYLLGGEAGGSSQSRPRTFISASEPSMPYSDRKLLEDQPFRLTDDDAVQIMCMFEGYDRKTKTYADKGMSIDEIATAMNIPHEVVRRYVAPDVATESKRQELASVGFSHMKRGW